MGVNDVVAEPLPLKGTSGEISTLMNAPINPHLSQRTYSSTSLAARHGADTAAAMAATVVAAATGNDYKAARFIVRVC